MYEDFMDPSIYNDSQLQKIDINSEWVVQDTPTSNFHDSLRNEYHQINQDLFRVPHSDDHSAQECFWYIR